MSLLIVRPAARSTFRICGAAMVELQEHERLLHATRLPGEAVADAYLAWMLDRAAEASGAAVIAEVDGAFAGFAAGWIEDELNIAETPDFEPLRAHIRRLRAAGLSRSARRLAAS